MTIGAAASGWFFFRAISVWEYGDETFGADMVITAVLILAWSAAAVTLLRPPSGVARMRPRPGYELPLIVWPLGRKWRWSSLIAIPITGPLGAFTVALIPIALSEDLTVPMNLLVWLPFNILLTAGSACLIVIALRGALLGVELTASELVAHGYFRTTRLPRESVQTAELGKVGFLADLLYSMARMYVDGVLTLTVRDGRKYVLYESAASEVDIERGAEIIQSWAAPHSTLPNGDSS